jgi:metallo-beta-lactamase family protein
MRPEQTGISAFATARFHLVASPQQSKALTASRKPAIVISSSGMATGGRVLHHLAAALPDPRHTVLFVGYQAVGTRGRLLVDGAREIKIHGRHIPVAARIARNDSMSAHADRGEIARWLGTLPKPPARVCLVHGEEGPMDALRALVTDRFGWKPYMPVHGERIDA